MIFTCLTSGARVLWRAGAVATVVADSTVETRTWAGTDLTVYSLEPRWAGADTPLFVTSATMVAATEVCRRNRSIHFL